MSAFEIDYDGEIAKDYDQGRRLSPEAISTWSQAIDGMLPDGLPIVDVGAGTGRFAKLLAAHASGPVVALEPAAGMRLASGESPDAGPLWVGGPAEAMPLRSASVGLVWSAFTTHYLDLAASAAEFRRILQPGGRVLMWHAFPEVFDGLVWFRFFPGARAIDEVRMPTAASVRTAFEQEGLEFVSQSEHQMLTSPSMQALADRMAHRSISTLRLISDDDFNRGLESLRRHAAELIPDAPVYSPHVMLEFRSV